MAELFVGLDLGTTNSAAAIFDGEVVRVARNSTGSDLTPSVVRIDAKQRITVGSRARRYLERDPENTASEFKRLMGTRRQIEFAAAGVSKLPSELSAEILKSLCSDIKDQCGAFPKQAVVSVPALFELPQSAATSKAAELAGLEKVELLQEPIASALAAGWTQDQSSGHWLVYDLGGGTFDVSLLSSQDGFLRVVGHDGDNFLGGRDFDWAVVDWAIEQINREASVLITREDPAYSGVVGQLKRAAEETKIELSRDQQAALVCTPPLQIQGQDVDVDIPVDRETLERLCAPILERSLAVCERMLAEHHVEPSALERVVFVGGPTLMPSVRSSVCARLGAPAAEGLDPMTVVARGAAIYAATSGLQAIPPGKLAVRGRRLWLKYPAVSTDLSPYVVGRTVDREDGPEIATIQLTRADGWKSAAASLDGEGAFVAQVELAPRKSNVFTVAARSAAGVAVEVHPSRVSIVQGATISDPPLSRSIGVALASDRVQVYFERGTPLPARRTFTHHTVESVAKGALQSVLQIPMVQGEHETAHLCRLAGILEIPGHAIKASLPAGASVELTLELDRGGALSARALVPALDQVFEEVAQLLVPTVDVAALDQHLEALSQRIDELRTEAFRSATPAVIQTLERADPLTAEIERDLRAARGGDEDAGQRARRNLLDLDVQLHDAEQAKAWPELDQKAVRRMAWASSWLSQYGTAREQDMFEQVGRAVDRARERGDVRDLERQLRLINQLGEAAWYRDPGTWPHLFEYAASQVDSARDLPKAQALVTEGRRAIERDDIPEIRRVTEKLWKLLPEDAAVRQRGFNSGVR